MKQLPLALQTDSGPEFDNFVPGGNLDCLMHLQETAECVADTDQADAIVPPPTYLYGVRGCGKTHLLQAVARALSENNPEVHRFGWLAPGYSWSGWEPSWRAIVIDDCDQLDDAGQAAAFRAFVDAQTYGGWVVAAGAVPPAALEVREDLRTRLGWGQIFALKPLSDEELQAALWQAFRSRGLVTSQDVLDYLMRHFSRDVSSMMRLLARLDRYALASKRAVTVPLIKSMLSDGEGGGQL